MERELKILLIDDYASMRKVISGLLKEIGFRKIVEAEDGVVALRILKSQKIDFIISDWNMPNMTGLELLKAVRADDDIGKTPFLMVTAEALHENVLEAVKAGVNNYIVKPFSAEVLRLKLIQILESIKE
jgi:two-component system, chemotaxis family, chemotaxis protein CheY